MVDHQPGDVRLLLRFLLTLHSVALMIVLLVVLVSVGAAVSFVLVRLALRLGWENGGFIAIGRREGEGEGADNTMLRARIPEKQLTYLARGAAITTAAARIVEERIVIVVVGLGTKVVRCNERVAKVVTRKNSEIKTKQVKLQEQGKA